MDKLISIYRDLTNNSLKSKIFWTGLGSAVILVAQYLGVLGILD